MTMALQDDEKDPLSVTQQIRIAIDGPVSDHAMLTERALEAIDEYADELEQSAPRGQHLLLVDDEVGFVKSLRRQLESAGFKVDVAWNAESALMSAEAWPFDGAVIDVMLAGSRGDDLVRQLRQPRPNGDHGRETEMPIILISGFNPQGLAATALACGASDSLVKPFPTSRLVDMLDDLLKKEDK